MSKGLCVFPVLAATFRAVVRANSFDFPSIKLSNVKFLFRVLLKFLVVILMSAGSFGTTGVSMCRFEPIFKTSSNLPFENSVTALFIWVM